MKEVAILPEQAPVMPLPGAILFPHALLPLYIFEPRYRQMLT
jgi:Lon protease-like protein